MNKNLYPTRTFRATRALPDEILGRQREEVRRLREEEEKKRKEEEERKRRAAEAQARATRLSESRPLPLPDTLKTAQPGPLADRRTEPHTLPQQPNRPNPPPRVQLPQIPPVDGGRFPNTDITLPGQQRTPEDLFHLAQQVAPIILPPNTKSEQP